MSGSHQPDAAASTSATDRTGHTPPGQLHVTVHNDDAGGPPKQFTVGPGSPVAHAISEAYKALGVTPEDGDRLICVATGQPVSASAGMHMRDYAETQCGDLQWSFSRATGGA